MSNSQLKTIEAFRKSVSQPALTAAINAGLRTGIFDSLREGQKTAPELAARCSLHAHAVPALMTLLKQTGLVEQFGEYYALSQAAQLASATLWALTFEQWSRLETSLRTEPDAALSEFERLENSDRNRQQFLASLGLMQWSTTAAAIKAAEALDMGDQRRSLHILDLGCGAAVYSMTLAHRDSGSLVRLVDNAEGLAWARVTVENLEMESRVTWVEREDLNIPGNDGAFDLVILGDSIHIWSAAEREQILGTAFRVLGPGGELAIIDVFPGQERGVAAVSEYQLQLLIGTGNPLIQPEHLGEMLTRAGFSQIQFTYLPAPPWTHGLMLGTRE